MAQVARQKMLNASSIKQAYNLKRPSHQQKHIFKQKQKVRRSPKFKKLIQPHLQPAGYPIRIKGYRILKKLGKLKKKIK